MNFINTDPEFTIYNPNNGIYEFYYKGIFDRSIDSIIETLSGGKFPENIKGNFAFFYKDQDRVFAAVDHLPNYNLFYTNDAVSHVINELRTEHSSRNEVIAQQMRFIWGGSLGTETNTIGIKRLEAGTYFCKEINGGNIIVKTYIDLFTHVPDSSISIGDLADITEQIIEENTREPFTLLWSSGTDSNCILGFIRKLNRTENCKLLSLYSKNSITDERQNIRYLESVYGLNSTFYNLGDYVGITDDIKNRVIHLPKDSLYRINFDRCWKGFWWENNIFQKYTALYDLKITHKPTITGEVGDQLFGSRFSKVILNLLIQRPNTTAREISELLISADVFRFNRSFISKPERWKNSIEDNSIRFSAYESAIDWVENVWRKVECGSDFINKIELIQYLYKGSHRANYTYFAGCNFIHPFADYRLFHTVFKTPGHWKIKKGKTRRLSLSMIENHVDSGPWNWAKSGIQIPAQHTSKLNP